MFSNATSMLWQVYAYFYSKLETLDFYIELQKDVLNNLQLEAKLSVLDAGCGLGYLLAEIERNHPDVKLWGLDFTKAMLERASKRSKAHLQQHDLMNPLPYQECEFDRVIALHSLYALPNPNTGLRNIVNVLKKGGLLVIVEPHPQANTKAFIQGYKARHGSIKTWIKFLQLLPVFLINKRILKYRSSFFSKERLQTVLEQSGLTVEKIETVYVGQSTLAVARKK